MSYYDTLDEDLARAKAILAEGKPPMTIEPGDWINTTTFGWVYVVALDDGDGDLLVSSGNPKTGHVRVTDVLDVRVVQASLTAGTIFGKDIYAAYKLLESFVAEIERLQLLALDK